MQFLKIIGLVFVAVVSYNVIKNAKPEFGLFIIVVAGAAVVIMLSDGIISSIAAFNTLAEKSGLDSGVFSSIIKIIGVGYITEYSSSVCEDGGCSSLGQKIQFAGKLTIFVMALPIITGIIDIIGGII